MALPLFSRIVQANLLSFLTGSLPATVCAIKTTQLLPLSSQYPTIASTAVSLYGYCLLSGSSQYQRGRLRFAGFDF